MRLIRCLSRIALVGVVAISTAGCDTNEPDEVEVGGVDITPDDVTLEVGETTDFAVEVLDVSGETIEDADVDIRWWSTDTDVFTVNDDGLATGESEGEATCVVEISSRFFTGRDSAFVSVLQF